MKRTVDAFDWDAFDAALQQAKKPKQVAGLTCAEYAVRKGLSMNTAYRYLMQGCAAGTFVREKQGAQFKYRLVKGTKR